MIVKSLIKKSGVVAAWTSDRTLLGKVNYRFLYARDVAISLAGTRYPCVVLLA